MESPAHGRSGTCTRWFGERAPILAKKKDWTGKVGDGLTRAESSSPAKAGNVMLAPRTSARQITLEDLSLQFGFDESLKGIVSEDK